LNSFIFLIIANNCKKNNKRKAKGDSLLLNILNRSIIIYIDKDCQSKKKARKQKILVVSDHGGIKEQQAGKPVTPSPLPVNTTSLFLPVTTTMFTCYHHQHYIIFTCYH